jgi:hypothetical protein
MGLHTLGESGCEEAVSPNILYSCTAITILPVSENIYKALIFHKHARGEAALPFVAKKVYLVESSIVRVRFLSAL